MSFFNTLEEYTVSPFKVGMNLAEDFIQTRELPGWKDIVGAFHKQDDNNLPKVEFTTNNKATELTDRIIEHGNVTISRVSDIYPTNSPKPFTLSQPAG